MMRSSLLVCLALHKALATSGEAGDDTCLLQTSTNLNVGRSKNSDSDANEGIVSEDPDKMSKQSAELGKVIKSGHDDYAKQWWKAFSKTAPSEEEGHHVAAADEDFRHESTTPCLMNQFGKLALPCNIEAHSREVVRKWLPANATVLEIGARYGSVSCVIAAMQRQSGKVVSVEPDPAVSKALDGNLQKHKCKVNVLKGVVGTTPLAMAEDTIVGGYATKTVAVNKSTESREIPAYPFDKVEKKFHMKFDTVVADCEGCFSRVLQENPQISKQAKLIIVEVHNDQEANSVDELQKKFGFKQVGKFSRQYVLRRL